MPIGYKILPDLELFITRPHGLVKDEELIAIYSRIFQDAQWHPGYSELADLRQAAAFDVTLTGFTRLAEMTAAYEGDAALSTAVLVDRPMNEMISRLYQSVAEAGGAETVRQFVELDDALEWLGISGFDPKLLDEAF